MTIPATAAPQATPQTAEQMWAEEAANTSTATADPAPAAPNLTPEPAAPAATAPAAPAAPAAPVTQEDPYAGLHPAVAERLKSVDGLAQRLRQTEGHIGGLGSQLKDVQQENVRLKTDLAAATKAAAASGAATPTTAAVQAAGKNSEKWKALQEQFPEWAEAVDERLGAPQVPPDLDALRTQVRDEITSDLTTRITADVRASIAAETESRLVNIAHRGWTDTVKTQAFVDWMGKQSPEVQALGASPVAEDAIQLLDSFKDSQKGLPPPVDPAKIKADRQARLKEAASIARGSNALAPVKSEEDMTPEELWNYFAAQDAAAAKAAGQR